MPPQEAPEKGIRLTGSAARALTELRRAYQVPAGHVLLITVQDGGCAGLSYGMDFVSPHPERHVRFRSEGHELVVERRMLGLLEGLEIDHADDALNRGFVFRNPRAAETCGCGSSFTVDS